MRVEPEAMLSSGLLLSYPMKRGNGGNLGCCEDNVFLNVCSGSGVHGVKVWSINASKDVKVWPLAAHADMLRVLA